MIRRVCLTDAPDDGVTINHVGGRTCFSRELLGDDTALHVAIDRLAKDLSAFEKPPAGAIAESLRNDIEHWKRLREAGDGT